MARASSSNMPFSSSAGAKSGCCSSKRSTRFIVSRLLPCSARLSAWCNCRVNGDSAGRPVFCARTASPPTNNTARSRTARKRVAVAPLMLILRKLDAVFWQFAGDHALPFTHDIKPINSQISERFLFPLRPQDFRLIETSMAAQPEMDAQIVLRQVTSAAEDFARLHQVSSCDSHARIQGQTIALCSYTFELKTDPMILRASFGTQNHGLAHQVFNHRFHLAIVEKIAHGKPAAHLRHLKRVSSQLARVFEGSVSLIDEQNLRLQVSGGRVSAIHLRIHVSVDQEEVLPAVVVEVGEGVAPAHIALRPAAHARSHRQSGELHPSILYPCIVAIQSGVLVTT